MYKIDKDVLLKESQELGFEEVEVDAIFESIEDVDMKEQAKEAFILASRNGAVKLTEAHLEKMAEVAEAKLEEAIQKVTEEYQASLNESIDDYLLAVGTTWLEENKLAVGNTVKADLFGSIMESLKTTFIEHNVSIPEDQIDILEEITLEEKETRETANKLFKENQALQEELMTIKRDALIGSLSVGMTESQKESFTDLAKAIRLDEKFESRIEKLSESIAKPVTDKKTVSLTESLIQGSKADTKEAKEEDTVINESISETQPKADRARTEEDVILNMC